MTHAQESERYTALRERAVAMSREPSISDEDREEMIRWAGLRMASAATPQARREAWVDLKLLITGRSDAQVERMEKARGLTT